MIKSLAQVCLLKWGVQSEMAHKVPAMCDQITCTNVYALDHRSDWKDKLVPVKYVKISNTSMSGQQHWSERNDTFSSKSIGQNAVMHLVPAKCEPITCTSMSA